MFPIGRSSRGLSRPRAECFSLTAGRGLRGGTRQSERQEPRATASRRAGRAERAQEVAVRVLDRLIELRGIFDYHAFTLLIADSIRLVPLTPAPVGERSRPTGCDFAPLYLRGIWPIAKKQIEKIIRKY